MTTQTHDANDVLMGGGGARTAKFEQPGAVVGGRIVAPPRAHQEREFDRNNPGGGKFKTFPSGDPIMGITVDVQTDQRDPGDAEDDGVRRIYIEGKRLKEAVRNAVRAAGADKIEPAGELWVRFTHLGEAAGPNVNPPKEYEAMYRPPAQAAVLGDQQQFPPAQEQQQAQQSSLPPQVQQQAAAWGQQVAQNAQTQTQQPNQQQGQPLAQQQYAQYAQTEQGAVNTATGEIQQQAAPQANGGPTPEAIAAVRAAGLDPAAVFPGYTG